MVTPNLQDYTYLLNRPDTISDRQTEALEKVISEFPYFQSARALRLKGLYNQNSFQYNYALKVTAAFTTDRSVLFDFITSDTFTAIHKGIYEQKLAQLNGIEVSGIEVIDPAKAQKDKIEASILNSIRESTGILPRETEEPETIEEAEIAPEEIHPEEIAPEEIAPDTVETPSQSGSAESLEIGKPLEFSPDEKHSFSEWLQLSRAAPIDRSVAEPQVENAASNPEKDKKTSLIDKFIESSPKIPPIRQDLKPTPIAEIAVDNSALMTETLARVYLEQRKYQKAIQAYEILILKYPEKSSFFADRISEIEKLQQNNSFK